MIARYVVLPSAERDLDEIADFLTVHASLEVALRFLEAAEETFVVLASHPGMGWRCKLRSTALAQARVFRVNGFEKILIFYRPAKGRIDIIRILQGAQDLEMLLQDWRN